MTENRAGTPISAHYRVALTILVATAVGATGCGSTEENLHGTWAGMCGDNPTLRIGGHPFSIIFGPSDTLIMRSTGSMDQPGHYTTDDDQLTMKETSPLGMPQTQTGRFSIDNNTLQLDALTDTQDNTTLWCTLTRTSEG